MQTDVFGASFNICDSDTTIDNFANPDLADAYISFIEANPSVNNFSLDEYVATFYGNNITDVTIYNQVLTAYLTRCENNFVVENIICIDNCVVNSDVSPQWSSIPTEWYHNTGESLPKPVSYDTYDMI